MRNITLLICLLSMAGAATAADKAAGRTYEVSASIYCQDNRVVEFQQMSVVVPLDGKVRTMHDPREIDPYSVHWTLLNPCDADSGKSVSFDVRDLTYGEFVVTGETRSPTVRGPGFWAEIKGEEGEVALIPGEGKLHVRVTAAGR
ncbi:hypothetical protein [Burkholderia sp. Ac-20365]|uniref:hypothetical protein n=1 Tax=Burkholderia sp. Ac-20365 TaxID=2703897 RepID=UPI00197BA8BA|nr:hypothetical protein [Burkholderia sp. Ac-20365]MBN3761272.1 hypothetical protein [Burkholderia sp. Ac-20365]